MSGLDNIINKIKEDNKKACDMILAKANSDVNVLIEESQKEAKIKAENIKEETLTEINLIKEKGDMAALRKQQNIILSKKNDYISQIIKEAEDSFLKSDKYLDFIVSKAIDESQSGEGVISLNKSDLDNYGKKIESLLKEKLNEDDKSIVLSNKAVDIKGGFILNYEKTVINSSIEEIVSSKIDEIKDKVNEILFN